MCPFPTILISILIIRVIFKFEIIDSSMFNCKIVILFAKLLIKITSHLMYLIIYNNFYVSLIIYYNNFEKKQTREREILDTRIQVASYRV